MRLFLFRHAEASYDAPSDDARELTSHGIATIRKLTDQLAPKHFSGLRTIHHSGLVRARQTAEHFEQNLGLDLPLSPTEHLRPEDNPRQLIPHLLNSSHDLLLTGHNPNLSHLTALLLTGDLSLPCIHFKKTGLLCLERLPLKPPASHPAGLWSLRWYLVPFGRKDGK